MKLFCGRRCIFYILLCLLVMTHFAEAQGRPGIAWMAGGHRGSVPAIAYAPDGQTFASCGMWNDGTVKLWRVSDGKLLRTLIYWEGAQSLAFSLDGQTLAVGSNGLSVLLYRVSDGVLLQQYMAFDLVVNTVAFSPDGQTLAASADNSLDVQLWRVSDGLPLQTLVGHTSDINTIAFSPDGQTLASGSNDNTVKLWRVSDGALLNTLTGHTSQVYSVAFSPDGTTLASAGLDSAVRLWRVSDGMLQQTLNVPGWVVSVAYSPGGQMLATCSGFDNGLIRLWRASDGTPLNSWVGNPLGVTRVVFSPDGLTLASSGGGDTWRGLDEVQFWQLPDGNPLRTLTGHGGDIPAVAFSPDGQTVASGSDDTTVRLWRASDGEALFTLMGHTLTVMSVAFSPDGQTLASSGGGNSVNIDGTIKFWRVADGTQITSWAASANGVLAVAFSPNGTLLASGGRDKLIKLWRVSDHALLRTLTGHTWDVNALAFSPDGSTLLSGSGDGTSKLWRVADGALLNTMTHASEVLYAAYSPTGQVVASSSSDGIVKLWSAVDGTLLNTLHPVNFGGDAIAFSPDGQRLITGSSLSTTALVQQWRVSDGLLLAYYDQETGTGVESVAFSPNGTSFVYGRTDATLVMGKVRTFTVAAPLNASGRIGQTISLRATLQNRQTGAPLSGKTLVFSVNGTTVGATTTGKNGAANLNYLVPDTISAGSVPLTVSFLGDDTFDTNSGTATLTLSKGIATLFVPGRIGKVGQTAPLQALLRRVDGTPIVGRWLYFSMDGNVIGSAVTDSRGIGTLTYPIMDDIGTLSKTYTISLGTNAAYEPVTADGTLTIVPVDTMLMVSNVNSFIGRPVNLRALLRRVYDRAPIAYRHVTFKIDGVSVGTTFTEENGLATLVYTIPESNGPGDHALTVEYAGEAVYHASMQQAMLTTTQGYSVVTVANTGGKAGQTILLRALLRRKGDALALVGKTLTFKIEGTVVGTAITGTDGVASLSYAISSSSAAGSKSITAEFEGNTFYGSSSGAGTLTINP